MLLIFSSQAIKKAAISNWDPSRFEEVLSSSDISPNHLKIIVQFWVNERDKVLISY